MHYDHSKKKLIVIIDNHLAQTYRGCAANFFMGNVEGYHKKSFLREGEKERIWNLEFGILLHKMLELYYTNFRDSKFDVNAWATSRAIAEWNEAGMDVHCEEKEYKTIGGLHGFVSLLLQFAVFFTPQNEKIRVLGSEVSFGRAGEVPLFIGKDLEIYLAGRMDLIVDDGYFICPMDHKTEGLFRGDPAAKYEMEEGPTGYIYALSKILPQLVPPDQILKRDCSKILMNLIQKKQTDNPGDRFKRVPIRKTAYQLEEYRKRMCSTVVHLIKDMERYAIGIQPARNTMMCTNWYHRDCVFRDVHRQGSREGELVTLANGYIVQPLWNTEEVKPTT
jgi:hypothetical protein